MVTRLTKLLTLIQLLLTLLLLTPLLLILLLLTPLLLLSNSVNSTEQKKERHRSRLSLERFFVSLPAIRHDGKPFPTTIVYGNNRLLPTQTYAVETRWEDWTGYLRKAEFVKKTSPKQVLWIFLFWKRITRFL
jgi:hypothetical protein